MSMTVNGLDGFIGKVINKSKEYANKQMNDRQSLNIVAQAGAEQMSVYLTDAIFNYEGDVGTVDIVLENTDSGVNINLVGDKVLYLEFGYGKPSEENAHPMQGWNGAYPGAVSDSLTGKGRWRNPPWYYGSGKKSYGMAPGRIVFDTAEYIRQNLDEILMNGGTSNGI